MADYDGLRLVTVSSNLHSKVIINSLTDLFDTKRGTDFDLRFDGRTVRAHRIILELLLGSNVVSSIAGEQHHASATVKQEALDNNDDSSNNILYSLLEFLYKGEVVVLESELDELLKVARGLNFGILEDAITSFSFQNDIVANAQSLKEEDCSDSEENPKDCSLETEATNAESPGKPNGQCFADLRCNATTPELQLSSSVVEEDLPTYSDESPYVFVEPEINIITGFGECQLPESESKEEVSVDSPCNASAPLLEETICEPPGSSTTEDGANDKSISSAKVTNNRKIFSCKYCSHTTKGKQGLDRHMNVVHDVGDRRFTCKLCDMRCYSHYELARHSMTHNRRPSASFVANRKKTPVQMEPNPIGAEPTKDKEAELRDNLGVPAQPTEGQETDSEDDLFTCLQCPSSFPKRSLLMRHIKVLHVLSSRKGMYGISCETCGKEFISRAKLNKHKVCHNKKVPTGTLSVCPHCTSSFKKESSLMTHITIVHSRNGFQCSTCGKKCITSYKLTEHSFSHT